LFGGLNSATEDESEAVEEPKIKAAKKKSEPAPTAPDLAGLLDEIDGYDD
jgi:hypothetical protein